MSTANYKRTHPPKCILENEKGKPHYPYVPHCVLFVGSNEPVKIKDEESGLLRRLIDIEPKSKRS